MTSIETKIQLNRFKPREYQLPIIEAVEKGYKRVMAVWPRRAGKDVLAFNIMLRQLLRKVGTYYYVLPTFASGRKILWDAIQIDGMKVLDYIPKQIIDSINHSEMKIKFTNGSLFQVIGSDSYDNTLVGTNPRGLVFSEFSLQDPRAYQFCRPILLANDGWALFLSTPRGYNHLYELYQIAKYNTKDWFLSKLTIEDTKHISLDALRNDTTGEPMSEDLIQQEYYTSFDMGINGSFYAKYFDKMRLNNQICQVPWEPSYPVYTSWDIGVRDSTAIIFFQKIGPAIRIIDCYEKSKEGLEHYISHIKSKPYIYEKHIGPHDIKVQEFGSGITRIEKARQLGLKFTTANDVGIMDGIEAVRSILGKVWIDQQRCGRLIKALENYRSEYDEAYDIYKGVPIHDWTSHFADAMRYLAVTLPRTREGLTSEEIQHNYDSARGVVSNMPRFFQDDYEQRF
jgi:phage terminase large subunit